MIAEKIFYGKENSFFLLLFVMFINVNALSIMNWFIDARNFILFTNDFLLFLILFLFNGLWAKISLVIIYSNWRFT